MFRAQTIEIDGTRMVIMSEAEYEHLTRESAVSVRRDSGPALPRSGRKRPVPALDFARVSIAREIIRRRGELGLSQQALADLAGVRQETLSRIETGKHTASVPTIRKVDAALKAAGRRRKRARANP